MTITLAADPDPDIAAAAARVGHYVWISARLFEITGAWAIDASDDAATACFAGVSGRFAWQADEWRRRLPFLREVDPERLVRAPDSETAGALAELADTPAGQRPAALAAVLARLDDVYRRHAEVASPLRDGAVLRSVVRVRGDVAAVVAELRDI